MPSSPSPLSSPPPSSLPPPPPHSYISDAFEVGDDDSVWDAWLTAVNLLDMLEQSQRLAGLYDFGGARDRIAQVRSVAEAHGLDKREKEEGEGEKCRCGLSDAEHALLRRKVLTFFKLQVANMKHFLA
ncbi:hypothetical protein [Nitrososphaera sp.]|uniref:hypothetical protein n=1 Tax=Nitrososphaera sp. TaxID=1971748 RepID=UPI00307F72D4